MNVPTIKSMSDTKFQIDLNLKFVLSFLALVIFLSEMHEQAHIITGYIFSGDWPIYRDFNNWKFEGGAGLGLSALIAGPLFTYLGIWIGLYLLVRSSIKAQQYIGLIFIFANLPMERALSITFSGLDEALLFKTLLSDSLGIKGAKYLAIGTVYLLTLPPVILAYRFLAGNKKILHFLFLALLPPIFNPIYLFLGMDNLLKSYFSLEVFALGTPLFILLHTIIMLLIVVLFRRNLFAIRVGNA